MEGLERKCSCFLILDRHFGVTAGQNGSTVVLVEGLLSAEEARHEEVEEGPELKDIVLDGSTREDETVVGLDELHGLGKL